MSLLQNIFSEQFIYALGWTLIHSLWQGALMGILIALAMVFLQKYTARLRYFIYSISLFVFAGLAIVTFISAYTSFHSTAIYGSDYAKEGSIIFSDRAQQGSDSAAIAEETSSFPFIERVASYCKTHIPLFVVIWLLGMLTMLLRFLGGYALVRRYKHQRVKAVMGEWDRRFKELDGMVRVSKNVRLLESALVKVPMAIGYLKPVILLPLGALNGVPAEQMEAILAHELAHIRRRDYLMNMIQSILEVIFFYHPVIWWLSGNIRIERENICDDIAITITGNTMEFAKALTNIQEINLSTPGLAAGLSGKNKNRLINRIRRLAGKPKIHSGFAEGFIAATIMVISLIGLSAAAMITYPVEEGIDPILKFEETSMGVPVLNNFSQYVAISDTTNKKSQQAEEKKKAARTIVVHDEEEELSDEQLKALQEAEEAIEAEMEGLEERMEEEFKRVQALEQYRQAMHDAEYERQEYIEEMQQAMQAYEEAMKESQYQIQESVNEGLWHHYNKGDYKAWNDDSLTWTYEYPDNFFLHGDSLKELYFDNWNDHFLDMSELELLMEEEKLEQMNRQLEHLDELNTEFFFAPRPTRPFVYEFSDEFFSAENNMGGRSKRLITTELYEDDLISHGREYMVVIGDKQMLINGEKQTRTVFKKYRRLIDSLEDSWQFDDEDEYKIFIGH